MNGEIIKSFLVGLGFDVDSASLSKFNKSIKDATLRVVALYGSVKLATAAIVYGVSEISEGFEKMGYEYRIISPMINKTLVLRQELLKAYKAAGINITKTVQASVKLNMSLTKTKFALEAIYKSVGSRFFALITKQSDIFRQKLYQNMPKIQNALERFIKFIFKAFEAVTELGIRLWSILSRVYDFLVMLHNATNGWSTVILAIIAAWNLLNLSFLATPLGMLLTGFAALLALWDDFKTFKEGGKSLFDWTAAAPKIEAFIELLQALLSVATDIVTVFQKMIHQDWSGLGGAFGTLLSDLNKINIAVDKLARSFEIFNGALDFRDKIDQKLAGFFGFNQEGSQNAAANIENNPASRPVANPVSSSVQNNQSNMSVSQQTSISVVGSADANHTAKTVANEQSKVNFDMVRNLKGSTR